MRWLRFLLSLAAAVLLAVTAASFLGDLVDLAELMASFRPQLFLAAILMLLLGILSWSRWTVTLAIFAAIANVWQIIPYYYPPVAAETVPADVTVLIANLQGEAGDPATLLEQVRQHRPDLVVVTGIATSSAAALEPLGTDYPFRLPERVEELRNNPHDLMLLSRHRILGHQFLYPTQGYLPVLDARLCASAASVVVETDGPPCYSLVALHARRPLGEGSLDLRNRQLGTAAGIAARDRARPVLVAGTLNVTPWSFDFGRLEQTGALRDTALGRGIQATWLSRFPFLGLPVGHVLVNGGFRALSVEVLPGIGSDHFPLLARLAFAGPPSAAPPGRPAPTDPATADPGTADPAGPDLDVLGPAGAEPAGPEREDAAPASRPAGPGMPAEAPPSESRP